MMNSVIGKRILILGCPGSGKSTLANKLHAYLKLPLVHLDNIFWKPDKTHISKDEFDSELADIINTDSWIIDGNYSRTLKMRLEKADTVVVFDYPLDVCLAGAKARVGNKRDDLPWIEEELDAEFEQWIKDFPTIEMPKVYSILEEYGKNKDIYVFHSRAETDKWLKDLNK